MLSIWTSRKFCFLAHLSTKCSELAIVITHRLLASIVCPFTFSCLNSSIYKHQPISTKLGQRIYDHKIMSSIFGVIGLEHLELFALELEKLLYFTLFTL